MSIVTIILIGLGLSMDALAVSVASGLTIKQLRIGHALRIGIAFGLFQAIMPIAGWFGGLWLKNFLCGIDHWIAFGLLSLVGGKMIWEANKLEEDKEKIDTENILTLFILAIATSIDALAVGLSLSLLEIFIITPAIIIGLITFSLSFAGVFVGNKIGHFFENKIEILGGIILISIGIKILIEHLTC